MREASSSRTVTDTDSCAFFLPIIIADEGMSGGNLFLMRYTTAQLIPRILDEAELPEDTLVLNITQSLKDFVERCELDEDFVFTPAHIMSFTQRAWVLSPDHANSASLILATYKVSGRGCLILGAFVFGRGDRDFPDFFVRSQSAGEERRCVFLAELARDEIWAKYVGHYLPLPKPGEANPVKYINFNNQNPTSK